MSSPRPQGPLAFKGATARSEKKKPTIRLLGDNDVVTPEQPRTINVENATARGYKPEGYVTSTIGVGPIQFPYERSTRLQDTQSPTESRYNFGQQRPAGDVRSISEGYEPPGRVSREQSAPTARLGLEPAASLEDRMASAAFNELRRPTAGPTGTLDRRALPGDLSMQRAQDQMNTAMPFMDDGGIEKVAPAQRPGVLAQRAKMEGAAAGDKYTRPKDGGISTFEDFQDVLDITPVPIGNQMVAPSEVPGQVIRGFGLNVGGNEPKTPAGALANIGSNVLANYFLTRGVTPGAIKQLTALGVAREIATKGGVPSVLTPLANPAVSKVVGNVLGGSVIGAGQEAVRETIGLPEERSFDSGRLAKRVVGGAVGGGLSGLVPPGAGPIAGAAWGAAGGAAGNIVTEVIGGGSADDVVRSAKMGAIIGGGVGAGVGSLSSPGRGPSTASRASAPLADTAPNAPSRPTQPIVGDPQLQIAIETFKGQDAATLQRYRAELEARQGTPAAKDSDEVALQALNLFESGDTSATGALPTQPLGPDPNAPPANPTVKRVVPQEMKVRDTMRIPKPEQQGAGPLSMPAAMSPARSNTAKLPPKPPKAQARYAQNPAEPVNPEALERFGQRPIPEPPPKKVRVRKEKTRVGGQPILKPINIGAMRSIGAATRFGLQGPSPIDPGMPQGPQRPTAKMPQMQPDQLPGLVYKREQFWAGFRALPAETQNRLLSDMNFPAEKAEKGRPSLGKLLDEWYDMSPEQRSSYPPELQQLIESVPSSKQKPDVQAKNLSEFPALAANRRDVAAITPHRPRPGTGPTATKEVIGAIPVRKEGPLSAMDVINAQPKLNRPLQAQREALAEEAAKPKPPKAAPAAKEKASAKPKAATPDAESPKTPAAAPVASPKTNKRQGPIGAAAAARPDSNKGAKPGPVSEPRVQPKPAPETPQQRKPAGAAPARQGEAGATGPGKPSDVVDVAKPATPAEPVPAKVVKQDPEGPRREPPGKYTPRRDPVKKVVNGKTVWEAFDGTEFTGRNGQREAQSHTEKYASDRTLPDVDPAKLPSKPEDFADVSVSAPRGETMFKNVRFKGSDGVHRKVSVNNHEFIGTGDKRAPVLSVDENIGGTVYTGKALFDSKDPVGSLVKAYDDLRSQLPGAKASAPAEPVPKAPAPAPAKGAEVAPGLKVGDKTSKGEVVGLAYKKSGAPEVWDGQPVVKIKRPDGSFIVDRADRVARITTAKLQADAQVERVVKGEFAEGDRIKAPNAKGKQMAGDVVGVEGGKVKVRFNNGETATLDKGKVQHINAAKQRSEGGFIQLGKKKPKSAVDTAVEKINARYSGSNEEVSGAEVGSSYNKLNRLASVGVMGRNVIGSLSYLTGREAERAVAGAIDRIGSNKMGTARNVQGASKSYFKALGAALSPFRAVKGQDESGLRNMAQMMFRGEQPQYELSRYKGWSPLRGELKDLANQNAQAAWTEFLADARDKGKSLNEAREAFAQKIEEQAWSDFEVNRKSLGFSDDEIARYRRWEVLGNELEKEGIARGTADWDKGIRKLWLKDSSNYGGKKVKGAAGAYNHFIANRMIAASEQPMRVMGFRRGLEEAIDLHAKDMVRFKGIKKDKAAAYRDQLHTDVEIRLNGGRIRDNSGAINIQRENTADQFVAHGLSVANDATFVNDNELSKLINRAKVAGFNAKDDDPNVRFIKKVGAVLLDQTVPYHKANTNIAWKILERTTPLGAIADIATTYRATGDKAAAKGLDKTLRNRFKQFGKDELKTFAELAGKLGPSMAMMYAGFTMAENDYLSDYIPYMPFSNEYRDDFLREQVDRRPTGNVWFPPTNDWLPTQSLQPFATAFLLGGLMAAEKRTNPSAGFFTSWAKTYLSDKAAEATFLQQPLLEGTRDMVKDVFDSKSTWTDMAASVGSSLIPKPMQTIAEETDVQDWTQLWQGRKIVRQGESGNRDAGRAFYDAFAMKTPFLRKTVAEKRDAAGKVVTKDAGPLDSSMNLTAYQKSRPHIAEARRLGIGFNKPVRAADETPEAYNQRLEREGAIYDAYLAEMYKDPAYDKIKDEPSIKMSADDIKKLVWKTYKQAARRGVELESVDDVVDAIYDRVEEAPERKLEKEEDMDEVLEIIKEYESYGE